MEEHNRIFIHSVCVTTFLSMDEGDTTDIFSYGKTMGDRSSRSFDYVACTVHNVDVGEWILVHNREQKEMNSARDLVAYIVGNIDR